MQDLPSTSQNQYNVDECMFTKCYEYHTKAWILCDMCLPIVMEYHTKAGILCDMCLPNIMEYHSKAWILYDMYLPIVMSITVKH